jgi:DNA-binding transcriptional ArsR family regulator
MFTYRALNLIFRALANPTRRHLFERLCDDENYVTALTEPLPVTRQAVSQHLAVLERNGLIHTEKYGTVVWCRIEPQSLCLLEQWLREHRGYYERSQAKRSRLR